MNEEYWSKVDIAEEARWLCSAFYSPPIGEHTYADPTRLIEAYQKITGSPYAEKLSRAVGDLLDDENADVRVVAAFFFTRWPQAVGSQRVLDVIENGPRQRVKNGDGDIMPTTDPDPYLIADCFAKALEMMASLGDARAQAIRERSDLPQLLIRTKT